MANNYLITGYWGEPHVTAENDRGFNAAVFGPGKFVLPVGERFRAEYIGNNTVRVYDGKLLDGGALAGIPAGKYIDFLIPEARQGMNRNDLIIFEYSQDASTLIESGVFKVVSGVETSGTAADPAIYEEDILSDEATLDQMVLFRVPVSGAVISSPVQLFTVSTSFGDVAKKLDEALQGVNEAMNEKLQDVELKKLQFHNVTVSASSFAEDATYKDQGFGFRAAVALKDVSSTMIPEVIFGMSDAISGNFSPLSETYSGGVHIYATIVPESDVVIPTIICWREEAQ